MIRVLLVDDDIEVRSSVRLILDGHPEMVVVGEVDDGQRGLALARRMRVDVVLTDIHAPGVDGLDLIRDLVLLDEPPSVIVLTAHSSEAEMFEALAVGAQGFLLKSFHPGELPLAVRDVAAGGASLSPSVAAAVIRQATRLPAPGSEAHADPVDDLCDLTPRERQLACAIGQGMSNAGIATDLGISAASAKTYVSRLLDKLGLQNRTQLAIAAHRAGLVR